MLKFIRGKSQQPSTERLKIQNELFGYTKTVQHGFPHKPTAMAYDPKLKLLAIGTQTGVLKIFGKPGIEFYGQHTIHGNSMVECSIQLLEWIAGTGKILSLTSGSQLTLWEPEGNVLNRLRTYTGEGKLKKISCLCCAISNDIIWFGTECGLIYQLHLVSFANEEPIIYHDIIQEKISEVYKLNPGAIESIKQLPSNLCKLLIGYNRGLCVLWDLSDSTIVKTFISPGHGETMGLYLNPCGSKFTWFHGDGSYATWSIDSEKPLSDQDYVPYGPDPCKGITNLIKGLRKSDEVTIFSGGMPRSVYGDRNCVSVHCNDGIKICLDFTSKVVDFVVVYGDEDSQQIDVLIVLLEEELCAFDLSDSNLAPIKIPYLHSIHASAVTCNYLVSDVEPEVYEKLENVGSRQAFSISKKDWPVTGGKLEEETKNFDKYEILITGHEDGSVKFWDCTTIVLKPLFHFKTAPLFGLGELQVPNDNMDIDEMEPPFKKAGQFDPYSDDPRLAIKKVTLCPKTGEFVVAGTAGHIIIANMEYSEREDQIHLATINLVNDHDGFIWKGHDELRLKTGLSNESHSSECSKISVKGIIQVLPPAAITCLALQTNYNLVAAGTAHGLVLYDYMNHHLVLSRCTLNPNDLVGAGENLSRRKSFKKTLRESFRRLRKGRSMRSNQNSTRKNPEPRTMERQVEARPLDDALSSMVRCLVFGKTFITNVHSTVPTLWVATNSSCVSVFILHIPKCGGDDHNNAKRLITAQLAKEIQMKHRAPVIGIVLFDQTGAPIDFRSPVGFHRVLIASEEQFKVFSLPLLKPITKYKLTAHEGARVRRLALANFSCQLNRDLIQMHDSKQTNLNADAIPESDDNVDRNYSEFALLCLTNLGDCLVLSIPELKRQLNVAAIRREDINGISSLCFTNSGEALFLISSSELQRISLSRTKIVIPRGLIESQKLFINEPSANLNSYSNDSSFNVLEETGEYDGKTDELNGGNDRVSIKSSSPTLGNETINSQIGDITVDSVKDHLNITTTTLCSTTEDIISKLSISSMQTKSTLITTNVKDAVDFDNVNIADFSLDGDKTEKDSSSVVIQSLTATRSQTIPSRESVTTKPMGKESSF